MNRSARPRLFDLLWRCCRLRCPVCGEGKLFTGPFFMDKACHRCGTVYEREQGFFLGAIYFNYGLTAFIATIAYLVFTLSQLVRPPVLLAMTLTFVALFPLWFFRYARSLWLGLDQYFDPRRREPTGPAPDEQRRAQNTERH